MKSRENRSADVPTMARVLVGCHIPIWVQENMLKLVGYEFAGLGMLPATTQDARRIAMLEGLSALRFKTGVDFGFDPAAWRRFLIGKGKEFQYMHPDNFKSVDTAVKTAMKNPEIIALLAELARPESESEQRMQSVGHQPGKLSIEGFALFLVEALIEAGIVERRQIMNAVGVLKVEIKNCKLLGKC